MATWQVQQAKSKFSELIDDAKTQGPQIITRHGAEQAVVLSISDYRALSAAKPDLRDYLLSGPEFEDFEIPRSRETSRKIRIA